MLRQRQRSRGLLGDALRARLRPAELATLDGEGHRTRFAYDIEKRVTQKTYEDTTFTQFSYDPYRNLLKQRLDAKGQAANYAYTVDDRVQQIRYTDAALQPLSPATATVSYIYDAQRPRLTSMTDGTGTTKGLM